ncbi:SAC domain-containing protein, partial [Haematococcus lacustris]
MVAEAGGGQAGGGGPGTAHLSRIYIYHTRHAFFIAGYCRSRCRYALIKIVRQDGPELQASEYPYSYTLKELNGMLRQIQFASQGGLQYVTKAYGIIGCIRFTSAYYLLIVTKKAHVGAICGHKVYAVRGVALVTLGAPAAVAQQPESHIEKRYRRLLMAVDLTKNFYFSLTYHLAASLQAS